MGDLAFDPNDPASVSQCVEIGGPPVLPSLFFKYRICDVEYHIDLLAKRKIYLTSPLNFNDPFDCRHLTDYSQCTPAQLRKIYGDSFQGEFSKAKRDKKIRDAILEKRHLDDKWQDVAIENSLRHVGVFSASMTWTNILLWSHYAAEHRGFCVCFDAASFIQDCNQRHASDPESGLISPDFVEYGMYPYMPRVLGDEAERTLKGLTSKAPDWSYEKEIRFINPDITEQRRRMTISPKTIHGVILGAAISAEHEAKILNLLGGELSHVRIRKAKRKMFAYELEFDRLRP